MSYEMTLTNNFWTCVHTLLFGTNSSYPIGHIYSQCDGFNGGRLNTIGSFKDTNGTIQTRVAGDSGSNLHAFALQLFAFGYTEGNSFAVGSGTTTATEDDYVVEAPIANASISVTAQQNASGSATFHVVVTATDNISVSEICLLKNFTTSATGTSTSYTVLIGRAVIDEPVALTNGQSKTFDITISLPKPTA